MSEPMDIDSFLTERQYKILVRIVSYRDNNEIWVWGPEETIVYPKMEKEDSDDMDEKPPKLEPVTAPTQAFWTLPKIETGLIYMVPNRKGVWVKAKLVEITPDLFNLVTLRSWERVSTTYLCLAHAEPVTGLPLAVGTRVIAKREILTDTGDPKKLPYRLGVVAEYPTEENRQRYLIIFDNEVWSYVKKDEVRPVYYTNCRVWEVVPCQKLVKEFLNGLYEAPIEWHTLDGVMVEFDKTTEEYLPGLIYNIDASLLFVWYESIKWGEWLYKGSPRIKTRNFTKRSNT